MPRISKSERVPKQMQPKFDAVTALTDRFCDERLSEEYRQLARQAAAALCRKRPSPLVRGRTRTWACGIVYALGFVNFLFDKSEEPYLSAGDLCGGFGVSKGAGAGKSREVRDALGMIQLDPNWCLPSMIDNNLLAWMISVDGFMVDARTMPREVQEIAYQKGLIPYIPDREETGDPDDEEADDPYLSAVQEHWDHIASLYEHFEDKKPIMVFDIQDQKIYAYPYLEFRAELNERSQQILQEQYKEVLSGGKMIVFVRDNEEKRLVSYLFGLEEGS